VTTIGEMTLGFVNGVVIKPAAGGNAVCSQRAAMRAAVRVQNTDNDLSAAQNCLEEGCEINEVQDILSRLESKKKELESEVLIISKVMGDLAKANMSKDRNFVAETMEAAINLFKRADDMYPKVGSPSPWTMDKPSKKKRWD